MTQHDYQIDNQNMPSARVDINNALESIASLNAGSAEPGYTQPGMKWLDTSNNIIKIRDHNDSSWIDYLDLENQELLLSGPESSVDQLVLENQSAPANNKKFKWIQNTVGYLIGQFLDDAGTALNNVLEMRRDGSIAKEFHLKSNQIFVNGLITLRQSNVTLSNNIATFPDSFGMIGLVAEGGTGVDDLEGISNTLSNGSLINSSGFSFVFFRATSGQTITVKHNASVPAGHANFQCHGNADIVFSGWKELGFGFKVGSSWLVTKLIDA